MAVRTIELDPPLDLAATLGILQRGFRDPTIKVGAGSVARASRTPSGAVGELLRQVGTRVEVEAWGPGSAWALEHAPPLLGSLDDAASFRPRHGLIAEIHRRLTGLRIPRTESVFEALVPTVLEQKVPGIQAWFSYRRLVEEAGEPAPGPLGLRLPPSAERLASLPSWTFHSLGVERRRADTLRRSALVARRIDETARLTPAEARRRLRTLPGIGAWSAAEVSLVALGDADAVSLGDYHLPHLVAWALAGKPRGSDELMLELLEPYRGHRGRVLRLLQLAGITAPRFGPRMPLRWIARS
ncbi:MAG: DNA-3-methyladenine glycosylase 2 family protein [Chloroflexi bacterium]|nr:MAG: DNA-3-methyladenine glycosylase 2 family protein [Chloroflexota bacterium]